MAYSKRVFYNDEVVRCKCDEIAVLRVSQKPKTRGMQFYGCPNYGSEKVNYCNFFQRVDKEVRNKELSEASSSNLLKMESSLVPESQHMHSKLSDEWVIERINKLEAKVADQMQVLKDQINADRADVERKAYIIIVLVLLIYIKFLFGF